MEILRRHKVLLEAAGVVAGVTAVGVSLAAMLKATKLPLEVVEKWARESRGTPPGQPPLEGFTALVTGATSGIGRELSATLFGMGASVVLLGRNAGKLERTVAELKSMHPEARGRVDLEVIDTQDLESVAHAATRLLGRYGQIDLLVNNAGVHYKGDAYRFWAPLKSRQGYDFCFATNYLGHFLLTHLLEPRLRATPGARVVQLTSTYHWTVSGADLWPARDGGDALAAAPVAAQADVAWPWWRCMHRNAAYANSKLAQLLHARALQRAWGSEPLAVSACPLFVSTGMTSLMGPILMFAFSVNAGLYAVLGAALMPRRTLSSKGDFVTNSPVVSYFPLANRLLTSWLFSATRLRELSGNAYAGFLLVLQRFSYGCHIQRTSPESYDEKLGDALYRWSLLAVSPYTSSKAAELSH